MTSYETTFSPRSKNAQCVKLKLSLSRLLPRMNNNIPGIRLKEERRFIMTPCTVSPTFSRSRAPAADKKPIATGCECRVCCGEHTDASFSKSSSFCSKHESMRTAENDMS